MGSFDVPSSASETFPCKDSSLPFWRTELHMLNDYRSTEEFPTSCDVLIVGGGYAGTSAAYHLLCGNESKRSPKPSVVLVEARQACSGATARNGGHLRPSVYSQIPNYTKKIGLDAAVEAADFEFDHVPAIAALVEKEKIECDFTLTRSFDIYTEKELAETAKKSYDELKAAGVASRTIDDLEWTDAEEAEEVSGVKRCVGCFTFTAAHLWPYKLVMHLLQRAISSGLNLQTHTPVTSISPSASPTAKWIATTPRGTITANRVIIATNGYTAGLLPEYTRKIVPSKGICCRIVTPPGSKHPELKNTYGLRLGNGAGDYLIP